MTHRLALGIAVWTLLAAGGALWAGTAGAAAPDHAPLPSPAPGAVAEGAEDTGAEDTDGSGAPAEAPPPPAEPGGETAADGETFAPVEPELPAIGPTQDPEAFAACLAELRELGAVFERLDPIEGAQACGAPRPLRLSAVGGVEIRPAAELRCPVARSLALWVERVVAPLSLLYLDDPLAAVVTGTDYQCRERRGDGSGRISEHAFANAVDVMGLAFASGAAMAIEERGEAAGPERSLQAAMRGGACAFFTTVLGPESDVAHSDHFHLDMAERRGGYRICE